MGPPCNLTFSYLRLQPLSYGRLRLQPLSNRRLRPIVALYPSSKYTLNPRFIYPRDKKIDFGRHKGCMLGTLPPSYLKWLAKIVSDDFSYWPKLAELVLQDPVYQDRVEWEPASRMLFGECKGNFIADIDYMKAYRDIGENFGWDMDDKEAWSKVNHKFIGTSFTERIPRKKEKGIQLGGLESVKSEESERKNESLLGGKRGERIERMGGKQGKTTGFSVGGKRGERIERTRLRRERNVQMLKSEKVDEEILEEKEEAAPKVTIKKERSSRKKRDTQNGEREVGVERSDEMITFAKRVESSENGEIFNPFPGREALFEKIRSMKG